MIIRLAPAQPTTQRAVILAKPESPYWLLFVLVWRAEAKGNPNRRDNGKIKTRYGDSGFARMTASRA
jgi:hypothetical protein